MTVLSLLGISKFYYLQALKMKIEEEKEHPTHQHADAFICVIMSYGDNGVFETSDLEILRINDDIVTPFDNENWRQMAGKPKIFLFQITHGGELKCILYVLHTIVVILSRPGDILFGKCYSLDNVTGWKMLHISTLKYCFMLQRLYNDILVCVKALPTLKGAS